MTRIFLRLGCFQNHHPVEIGTFIPL